MITRMKQIAILFLTILIGSSNVFADGYLKKQSLEMLRKFCDVLISQQVSDRNDPNYGALLDPATGKPDEEGYEAIYPLAVVYHATKQKKYGIPTIRLANWIIQQSVETNLNNENVSFAELAYSNKLFSMALAYPILQTILPSNAKRVWKSVMFSLAEKQFEYSDEAIRKASSRELARAAASMACLNRIIPADKFRVSAERFSFEVCQRINEEGFVQEKVDAKKDVPNNFDIGTTLESTLVSLAICGQFLEREDINQKVQESLISHLYFIYPDGSLDNSCGIYSSDWTSFGNVNTNGCQAAFSAYSNVDSRFEVAAQRNLGYLANFFEEDVLLKSLGMEPFYVHSPVFLSFAKRAVNLALAIEFGQNLADDRKVIPADIMSWYKHFKSANILVVRTRNYMVTISGCRAPESQIGSPVTQKFFRPGGGVISNFWSDKIGMIQAASHAVYQTPDFEKIETLVGPLPFTSRIECIRKDGYFSNLYDFNSKIKPHNQKKALVQVSATGWLKDHNQKNGEIKYTQKFTFDDNSITKDITIEYEGKKSKVAIFEPFLLHGDAKIKQIGPRALSFKNGFTEWQLQILSGECELAWGECSIPGDSKASSLRSFPIVIGFPQKKKGEQATVVYRLVKIPTSNLKFADFKME